MHFPLLNIQPDTKEWMHQRARWENGENVASSSLCRLTSHANMIHTAQVWINLHTVSCCSKPCGPCSDCVGALVIMERLEKSVIGEKRKGLTGWMSFSCLSHCTSWIISSHNVFSLLFMYIKPFIKRKCQGFTEGFWKCSFYAYYVHLSMASRKSTQVLIAGKQRETEAIKSDLVLKALLKDFCSTFKLSLKKKQTKCFLLSGKLYTCSFYSKKIHWTYCWCWSWPTTWRCRPGRSAWCSSCAGRESSWWRWTASGSPQRSQACSSRGSSSCLS